MPSKSSRSRTLALSKSQPYWYGIMLDYELDLTQGYWQVRYGTSDLKEVEQALWITGNPVSFPSSLWQAVLLKPKSLSPVNSGTLISGGIYRFSSQAEANA